jgi:membrane protease YdiL (CAAX protease family)
VEQQVGLGLGITLGLGTAILFSLLVAFIRKDRSSQHPGRRALLQVGILFLPALPAYLWVWPSQTGSFQGAFQVLVYVYILAGTILIGLRSYHWDQLGVNGNGIGAGLVYGALLITGRSLVILAVDWGASLPAFDFLAVLSSLAYCILIGITEELLFRGLIYRVLVDWRGVRWAIWGSSVGFVLWHIFGHGPLVGAAMLLYGLTFALMRWRAGGITALIITHALVDFFGFQMLPDANVVDLGRPEIPHPFLLLAGLGLIAAVPLFLWLGHGKTGKIWQSLLAGRLRF